MSDEINFDVSKEKVESLTWEEFEYFELSQEGEGKLYQLRPVLARFMVDENKQTIEHARAMKMLGKLPVMNIKDIAARFTATLKGSAVPKENASPSSSPIEATQS